MTVLVTGGRGLVGSRLVPLLRSADVPVVVASRSADGDPALQRRLDLRTGDGLARALDGVRTVVALHSDPRHPTAVDAAGTARLAEAARAAGAEHLVLLSILGSDRVPFPLYRAKVAAEEAVAGSGTGWTVLRAAQFHEFVHRLVTTVRAGSVVAVPRGWAAQPVDLGVVVDELAGIVRSGPRGRVPDLAGPQRLPLADAARLAAGRRRTRVLALPVPGRASRAFRAGGNLPEDGARLRGPSFTEWLKAGSS
ncbi:SDR family oxidoreductase [Thalassiella azotivora]